MEQDQVKTLLQECKHYQERMRYWHRKSDKTEKLFELYQEVVRENVNLATYKKITNRFTEMKDKEE